MGWDGCSPYGPTPGTEQQFHRKFGRSLAGARQASQAGKQSAAQLEAGMLAMEALHKQVMPFILRRTKDQVLSDLPPKIIQDVCVALSPLQRRLYEDFQHSDAQAGVSAAVHAAGTGGAGAAEGATPHIFQALQYLRKLCSHPLLVLDAKQEAHRRILEDEVSAAAAEGVRRDERGGLGLRTGRRGGRGWVGGRFSGHSLPLHCCAAPRQRPRDP